MIAAVELVVILYQAMAAVVAEVVIDHRVEVVLDRLVAPATMGTSILVSQNRFVFHKRKTKRKTIETKKTKEANICEL